MNQLEAVLADRSALGKHLDAAERVLAAVRASIPRKTDALVPLFGIAGGAVGGAVAGVLSGSLDQSLNHRNPLAFKLPPIVAVSLTDKRIMFWSFGGWVRPRPQELLGSLPFEGVREVQYSMRRRKLAFWFEGGATLELDSDQEDAARRLATLATERIAALR